MRAGPRLRILAVLLLAGCGAQAAPRPALSSVVLLIEGAAGDRGPYDFAAGGVAAFRREEGVEVPLVALGEDPLAWDGRIQEAVAEPAHRVFIIGMEGPARRGLEQARRFPEKRFVLLGLADPGEIPPNAWVLSFDEWTAGWLAGYLAGHLAGLGGAPGRRVGALVGPGAAAALAGYRCGAQAAGVGPEDFLVEEVPSAADPVAGLEAGRRLYGRGAAVALGLAGGSSAGLFEAAAAAGRYAIGFGADWYARYAAMRAPAAEALLGSVTPGTDEAVRGVLRQLRRGPLPFGTHRVMGWADGGIRWRGSPLFFRIAPAWLQRQIQTRALRPEPCR